MCLLERFLVQFLILLIGFMVAHNHFGMDLPFDPLGQEHFKQTLIQRRLHVLQSKERMDGFCSRCQKIIIHLHYSFYSLKELDFYLIAEFFRQSQQLRYFFLEALIFLF